MTQFTHPLACIFSLVKHTLITLLFASTTHLTHAKITHSNNHSFTIEITSRVNTTPQDAYRAFLSVDQWWIASHSYFGKRENFSITPVAGGCFCEIDGDKQVQHLQVSYVNPGKEIRLLGGLGPLQMMAANGAMQWTFSENATGGTTITQTYRVTALDEDTVTPIANAVNSVQQQQQNQLTDYIKANKKP